ncbi:hypothetical protein QFC20_006258 [Naganishia adeliensis]|uniref:Uncharacterized protein n=1 Tax=Naganishia adeliensis TaxID=92952 RepID=A0ACC2VDQ3_9TREE|nr:hypothetical protein QFC20_006258 [Naganishia adeliensis]
MSSIDPLSTSVTQWLFSAAELAHSPSQQPSMHPNAGHADDSMTFEQEYQARKEAIKFLAAVEKDLQGHNPVKVQVDNWKAQQKNQRAGGMMGMQQGMMGMGMNGMQSMPGMSMGMGGMGMQYGRPGQMSMSQMGMQQQQHGRYGQTPNGHNGVDQQVNLDAMSTKDLLAYSGTFGHPNSAEYLHWVNVNQEYEQEIAAACLYLALKAEERMNIKIRVIARAFKGKLGQHNAATDSYENTIAQYEELILETLCYDLPIPQPLGYILRAHSYLYPLPPDLQDPGVEKEKEKEKEKKPSVWGEDENTYGLNRHRTQRNRELQEKLEQYQEQQKRIVDLKQRRKRAQETMRGEELERAAVLDMAYVICDETKTSPLCLLSLANYIASASYLLAECMMYDIPLREAFDKVDQRWVEAFGGRELRLSGEEGVDKFKRSLADTVRWLLEVQNMGLMSKVISDWLKPSDVPPISASIAKVDLDDVKTEDK